MIILYHMGFYPQHLNKLRVCVISSTKTLDKGETILHTKALGNQNALDPKLKTYLFDLLLLLLLLPLLPLPFLLSFFLSHVLARANWRPNMNFGLISPFYTPISLQIATKSFTFLILQSICFISTMAHLYTFYDFYIPYGNYIFLLF